LAKVFITGKEEDPILRKLNIIKKTPLEKEAGAIIIKEAEHAAR